MNPGVSLTTTGVLPHFVISDLAASGIAGEVPAHGTTSTSGRMGAGLKKCRPITRSGCLQALAIAVTDKDDVFVASTAVGPTTCSMFWNNRRLSERLSTIASMTSPQPSYLK